jgi:transcriptional regulator with XRE-family HTH domain
MSKSPYLIALGHAIRSRRKQTGQSQEALAFDADLDRTYIGGVERGERNITILNLLKIAKALNVAASVLMADVERSA